MGVIDMTDHVEVIDAVDAGDHASLHAPDLGRRVRSGHLQVVGDQIEQPADSANAIAGLARRADQNQVIKNRGTP